MRGLGHDGDVIIITSKKPLSLSPSLSRSSSLSPCISVPVKKRDCCVNCNRKNGSGNRPRVNGEIESSEKPISRRETYHLRDGSSSELKQSVFLLFFRIRIPREITDRRYGITTIKCRRNETDRRTRMDSRPIGRRSRRHSQSIEPFVRRSYKLSVDNLERRTREGALGKRNAWRIEGVDGL